VAVVLTLKTMVSPGLTLMLVAKPWIVGSPASWVARSQVLWGVPGRQFSASMGFAGEEHEAPAGVGAPKASAPASNRNVPPVAMEGTLLAMRYAIMRDLNLRSWGRRLATGISFGSMQGGREILATANATTWVSDGYGRVPRPVVPRSRDERVHQPAARVSSDGADESSSSIAC
jgi:hypothetical protein